MGGRLFGGGLVVTLFVETPAGTALLLIFGVLDEAIAFLCQESKEKSSLESCPVAVVVMRGALGKEFLSTFDKAFRFLIILETKISFC
jgi:hypothetical protein